MDKADPHFHAFGSQARILQSPGRLPPRGPHMNCKNVFKLKKISAVMGSSSLFIYP